MVIQMVIGLDIRLDKSIDQNYIAFCQFYFNKVLEQNLLKNVLYFEFCRFIREVYWLVLYYFMDKIVDFCGYLLYKFVFKMKVFLVFYQYMY